MHEVLTDSFFHIKKYTLNAIFSITLLNEKPREITLTAFLDKHHCFYYCS